MPEHHFSANLNTFSERGFTVHGDPLVRAERFFEKLEIAVYFGSCNVKQKQNESLNSNLTPKICSGVHSHDFRQCVKNSSRWPPMTPQLPTFPLALLCCLQRSEAEIKTEYSYQYWLPGFWSLGKSIRRKGPEFSKTEPNLQSRSRSLTFHILGQMRRALRTIVIAMLSV